MSENHSDADHVKVTRTTTTYEPAGPQAVKATQAPRRPSPLVWIIGAVIVVVLAIGIGFYINNQNASVAAQQAALAPDPARAQALNAQAASAEQRASDANIVADQTAAKAQSLTAAAAHDRVAAKEASGTASAARP